MHFKFLSTTLFSLAVLFVVFQNVACKQDATVKARLNRRKIVKRQGYYQGYPPASVYTYPPITPETYYYAQPAQPAAAAVQPAPAPAPAPAAAEKPENPLELGGLLANLKLPDLSTFAPPAGGSNPYAGLYYGAAAPKKDDDDEEEDEEDDDKNDEDADDEE